MTGEELARRVAGALPELAGVDAAELARSRAAQQAVEVRLRAADADGRWWPRGAVAACRRLSVGDMRFAFVERLGRSWAFGELIAGTLGEQLSGSVTADALELAGLLNVFVTTFDGICDEIPELLPAILPPLAGTVAAFPALPPGAPGGGHPLVELAWAAVRGAAARLAAGLSDASAELREATGAAVRDAYAAQLATLAPRRDDSPAGRARLVSRRSAVSAGPMRVAVLIPLVQGPRVAVDLAALDLLACELGRHFGWIDDLVDLEQDLRYDHPNAVAVCAGLSSPEDLLALDTNSPAVGSILCEASERWMALRTAVARTGLNSRRTDERLALATGAWLGTLP